MLTVAEKYNDRGKASREVGVRTKNLEQEKQCGRISKDCPTLGQKLHLLLFWQSLAKTWAPWKSDTTTILIMTRMVKVGKEETDWLKVL